MFKWKWPSFRFKAPATLPTSTYTRLAPFLAATKPPKIHLQHCKQQNLFPLGLISNLLIFSDLYPIFVIFIILLVLMLGILIWLFCLTDDSGNDSEEAANAPKKKESLQARGRIPGGKCRALGTSKSPNPLGRHSAADHDGPYIPSLKRVLSPEGGLPGAGTLKSDASTRTTLQLHTLTTPPSESESLKGDPARPSIYDGHNPSEDFFFSGTCSKKY